MMIYIFRHGEAAVTGKAQRKKPEGSKEDERHLTSRGKLWVNKVASLANENLGFEPEVIMSSPLPRARETAEVAKKVLGLKSEIIIEEGLVAAGKVEGVYQALRKLKGVHSVALVSHQPLVKNLVADLTGGKANIWVYIGAIACIQCSTLPRHGKGTLVWLLPPLQWYNGKKWP